MSENGGIIKPMVPISDQELISQYLRGNEKAFETLVKRYLKPIYRFVYYYTGRVNEVEDITQEAFLKVWKSLKKFDSKKSFKTWLFSIAKNTAIDFFRKKKDLPLSEFDQADGSNILAETLADPKPLPDEIFDHLSQAGRLNKVIEKLSPQYQLVLFLHYNEHLTFQEIAESLGEPIDTVKSRHRRALIILRKILPR